MEGELKIRESERKTYQDLTNRETKIPCEIS